MTPFVLFVHSVNKNLDGIFIDRKFSEHVAGRCLPKSQSVHPEVNEEHCELLNRMNGRVRMLK